MAEDDANQPFKFTPQGGKLGASSRDYTGRGLAEYPTKDQYQGEYLDGIRQGKGKYLFENGNRYEGDFKQNKKHGIGKLTYKDKGEYYGQWENGLKHGQGVYTYTNKDTYSGWWQFGKKQGKGTYIYADTGMRLVGDWADNKLVTGRWILPNGTYYEGQFSDNKPNGQGTWYFKNGNQLKGSYTQAKVQNEDAGDEDDAIKEKIKLQWLSEANLFDSAAQVNAHQSF